jgi:putative hydrolase of the HAD superfamily
MTDVLKFFLEPVKVLQPIPTGRKSGGKQLSGIKAFLFDIYGTMLISASGDVGSAAESGSAAAFKTALSSAGVTAGPDHAYSLIRELFFNLIDSSHNRLRLQGFPYPEVDIIRIWSEILSDCRISALIPELNRLSPETAAAAYESTVNPVYPMPEMFDLFDHPLLKKSELGIISNAQFYTPRIFDYLINGGLSGLGFNTNLCLFSYLEKRAKPDLKLFSDLTEKLARLDIKPSEAVFIGNDMLNDIMPAAVSGYRTVLFAGDKRSLRLRKDHDACKDIKPDVIVNNLIEIIDYIQEG